MKNLEAQILETKKFLEKLELEREELHKLPIEVRVANELHRILCHANHTDGCGWEYENAKSYFEPNSTRARYYKKALAILEDEDDKDTVYRIISKITW